MSLTSFILLLLIAIECVVVVVGAVDQSSIYRINCGGPTYLDQKKNLWSEDKLYNHGASGTFPKRDVLGTNDDVLYLTERWEPTDAPLKYTLPNLQKGKYDIKLYFAEMFDGAQAPGKRVFDILLNGKLAAKGYDIVAKAGGYKATMKHYRMNIVTGKLEISFKAIVNHPKISAIEVYPTSSSGVPADHIAHAVPGDPQTVVDLNNDGFEIVHLDGHYSHTHAPPPIHLAKYEWKDGDRVIGTKVVVDVKLSIGVHKITLTVVDSADNSASDSVIITVLSPELKGLEGYYYKFNQDLTTIPPVTGLKPVWGQLEATLNTPLTPGNFRGTPFNSNFLAVYKGYIDIPADGTYKFALNSDDGSRLTINNKLVIDNNGVHQPIKKGGSIVLKKGHQPLLLEYFNKATGGALQFYWTKPGAAEAIVPATALLHYQYNAFPIIHSLSNKVGTTDGGNRIKISGFGFVYPTTQTTVQFGGKKATGVVVSADSSYIEVAAPANAAGKVQVTVTTPKGTSNGITYEYSSKGPVAVQFSNRDLLTNIPNPTCLALGPDEKLYVATVKGIIWRITLDDKSNIVDTFQSNVLQDRNILGIAFNPRDTSTTNIRVYASHNKLYHNDPYHDAQGIVSVISGANLNAKEDIITGLPVSERDHGVNGLSFTQKGDLLFMVGSNTNAGIPGPLTPHQVQTEKQFSACCAIAHITRPNFNGKIKYTNDDSEHGQQIGRLDVEVYASGIKNSFNLVHHSNGQVYFADNGPTAAFGAASTSCTTEGPGPHTIDELNVLKQGSYYGHPNRARGAKDPRQCVYHPMTDPSTADYTAPIDSFPSSVDGIIEYTANAFGGQLRHHLILGRYKGELWDVTLSADGQKTTAKQILTPFGGLNVVMNTDGSLISTDYENARLAIVTPVEDTPTELSVLSVFPTRGVIAGGNTLSIRGYNFGNDVQVSLGGKACTIQSKSANRIRCTVPKGSSSLLADLVVKSGTQSTTLEKAYKYMEV
jgi:glucose/arabinose dehydrogenase